MLCVCAVLVSCEYSLPVKVELTASNVAHLLIHTRFLLPHIPLRASGQRVLLLVSLEHRGLLAKAALKLAKLSVREIVDQLHVSGRG